MVVVEFPTPYPILPPPSGAIWWGVFLVSSNFAAFFRGREGGRGGGGGGGGGARLGLPLPRRRGVSDKLVGIFLGPGLGSASRPETETPQKLQGIFP